MACTQELLDIGNAAFQQAQWEKAIMAYAKAIELDPTNVGLYSQRSTAYLQWGDGQLAIQDADTCISTQPDYSPGYVRKAAVLVHWKKYGSAQQVYQDGLDKCRATASTEQLKALEHGLRDARIAQQDWSQMATQRRRSYAARRASQRHAAPHMWGFVQAKQRQLKLQIAAHQAELEFIDLLNQIDEPSPLYNDMSSSACGYPTTKLQLLFNVMDSNRDGYISASELAKTIQIIHQGHLVQPKDNEDDAPETMLSFEDALQQAIQTVAIFAREGDLQLNETEFQDWVRVTLTELHGLSFTEFANFVILQTLFGSESTTDHAALLLEDIDQIDSKVKERKELLQIWGDERLIELFDLFDTHGTRELSWSDVAAVMYPLIENLEASARSKLEAMLLVMEEENNQEEAKQSGNAAKPMEKPATQSTGRGISYKQFGRLIMAIVKARNVSLDQVADELVLELTLQKTSDISEYDNNSRAVQRPGLKSPAQAAADQATLKRIGQLFDVMDKENTGTLGQRDISRALTKFEETTGTNASASGELDAPLFQDSVANALDREEFSQLIQQHAQTKGWAIHDVIDYLFLRAVLPESRAVRYTRAYRASFSKLKTCRRGPHKPRQTIRLEYDAHDNNDDDGDDVDGKGNSDDYSVSTYHSSNDNGEDFVEVSVKDEDDKDNVSVEYVEESVDFDVEEMDEFVTPEPILSPASQSPGTIPPTTRPFAESSTSQATEYFDAVSSATQLRSLHLDDPTESSTESSHEVLGTKNASPTCNKDDTERSSASDYTWYSAT